MMIACLVGNLCKPLVNLHFTLLLVTGRGPSPRQQIYMGKQEKKRKSANCPFGRVFKWLIPRNTLRCQNSEWNIYRVLKRIVVIQWLIGMFLDWLKLLIVIQICTFGYAAFLQFGSKKISPCWLPIPLSKLGLVASTCLPRSIAELHSSVGSNLHLEIK